MYIRVVSVGPNDTGNPLHKNGWNVIYGDKEQVFKVEKMSGRAYVTEEGYVLHATHVTETTLEDYHENRGFVINLSPLIFN